MSYNDLPGGGWGHIRHNLLGEIGWRIRQTGRCLLTLTDWAWTQTPTGRDDHNDRGTPT